MVLKNVTMEMNSMMTAAPIVLLMRVSFAMEGQLQLQIFVLNCVATVQLMLPMVKLVMMVMESPLMDAPIAKWTQDGRALELRRLFASSAGTASENQVRPAMMLIPSIMMAARIA